MNWLLNKLHFASRLDTVNEISKQCHSINGKNNVHKNSSTKSERETEIEDMES